MARPADGLPPPVSVRLKGDRIVLRLGAEQRELSLGADGVSGEAWNLARALQGRMAEVADKRRRAVLAEFADLAKRGRA